MHKVLAMQANTHTHIHTQAGRRTHTHAQKKTNNAVLDCLHSHTYVRSLSLCLSSTLCYALTTSQCQHTAQTDLAHMRLRSAALLSHGGSAVDC